MKFFYGLSILIIFSSISFSQQLDLNIKEATYSVETNSIMLTFEMHNHAAYSQEGIPFIIPESYNVSESAYNSGFKFYGLGQYSYHFVLGQSGECNQEPMLDMDPDPEGQIILAPEQQRPKTKWELEEEHIFSLRGGVTKTFKLTIYPRKLLCNNVDYAIQLSYKPEYEPIDPEVKASLVNHLNAYQDLVEEINADLKTKGFEKRSMVGEYCSSKLKALLKSYEMAESIPKMEIRSEVVKVFPK